MGSTDFYATSKVTNPKEAYDELVATALFENGHEPYNGTISTTQGFRVVTSKPMSSLRARMLAEQRVDALAKWGACEAVAVGTAGKARTRKLSLTVVPAVDDFYVQPDVRTVAAKLGVDIDLVESFRIVAAVPRVKTTSTPAGSKSRYWTTSYGGRYASRPEAVAAAKEALTAEAERIGARGQMLPSHRRVEILEKVEYAPPASIEQRVVSVKFTLEVDVATSPAREFSHWLFYGRAAC